MSTRSVRVHPLVIVSACDHHTRVTVGGSLLSRDAPTIGLLFGNKREEKDEKGNDDNTVHVVDATDAVYTYDSETKKLDLDIKQLANKRDLWEKVYPTQPLMGWYIIGSEVTPLHLSIHEGISSLTEDPDNAMMLLMNPEIDGTSNQLPILLFKLEAVGSQQEKVFMELPFKLESSPIESAVMDTVIKMNPPDGVTSVEVQNESMLVSLKALLSRVDIILEEISRMESGEIPIDYPILQKAAKICNLLPDNDVAIPPQQLQGIKHVTDSLTLSLLGTVASNLRQLHALQGAYQDAYSERSKVGHIHSERSIGMHH